MLVLVKTESMKIGLAQINTTVGDLNGNCQRILDAYHRLCDQGADLVVFPELVITGYPPRDLLFKSRFVPDNLASLKQVAGETGTVPAVVGFVDLNRNERGRRFFNAVAWCAHGAIQQTGTKTLLPTYDVFDEDRYFESAQQVSVVEHQGCRIGLSICEDIWTGPTVETSRYYNRDPLAQFAEARVDILLNVSASPWHYRKDRTRQDVVSSAAQRIGAPTVYVNAVGGNDELIFDGHSMAVRPDGSLIDGLSGFREELKIVDMSSSVAPSPQFGQTENQDIFDALTLGLRDYAHKSGFRKGLIGLSGGIDSSLVAVIAAEALGAENITGVSLPSQISSQHSRDDAKALAKNLHIKYHTLPIRTLVEAASDILNPLFAGTEMGVAEENIQARSRGLLLMAVSNKYGALLLTTGNKSEMAVGYCTLYGDMAGGLAVISDLPKTRVYELARWINRDSEIIPWNTINKPPSAELRPDQTDQDSLPPYDILDAVLERYVEQGQSSQEIIDAGFAEEVVQEVIRKVDLNEYKRKQAAPGLKITPLAFGVGRRIPIVQKYVS